MYPLRGQIKTIAKGNTLIIISYLFFLLFSFSGDFFPCQAKEINQAYENYTIFQFLKGIICEKIKRFAY